MSTGLNSAEEIKKSCPNKHLHPSDNNPVEVINSSQVADLSTTCISKNTVSQEGRKEGQETSIEKNQVPTESCNQPKQENTNHPLEKQEANLPIAEKKDGPEHTEICRFYARTGWCRYGRGCRYKHIRQRRPHGNDAKLHEQGNGEAPPKTFSKPQRYVPPQKQTVKRDSITADELSSLRQTEIDQLIKRFPQSCTINNDDKSHVFCFQVKSTDPDWPYDVSSVDLEAFFPLEYPKESCKIYVSEESELPDALRIYLNDAIEEWIQEGHDRSVDNGSIELTFRPFLRWFDRNMEDLFTEGLRKFQKHRLAAAAGIEFIPSGKVPRQPRQSESSDKDGDMEQRETPSGGGGGGGGDTKLEHVHMELKGEKQATNVQTSRAPAPQQQQHRAQGVEIRLRGVDLGPNIGILKCSSVGLIVTCARCRTRGTETLQLPANKTVSTNCIRCSTHQLARYVPGMVHSGCGTLGVLQLQGCSPLDMVLVDCHVLVSCFNCDRELELRRLQYGQQTLQWCRHCHQKISFVIDGTKFVSGASTAVSFDVDGAIKVPVKKTTKRLAESIIRDGQPLPDKGTCCHYKKSFRWFRFPCCGKCYPCDRCHDENEDHEMEMARRYICGFCAKEQPLVSDKPCVRCDNVTTKMRTAHWEGGKGCRDKVKMSRNEDRKHANENKTVSRKQQNIIESKQKKKKK